MKHQALRYSRWSRAAQPSADCWSQTHVDRPPAGASWATSPQASTLLCSEAHESGRPQVHKQKRWMQTRQEDPETRRRRILIVFGVFASPGESLRAARVAEEEMPITHTPSSRNPRTRTSLLHLSEKHRNTTTGSTRDGMLGHYLD